MIHCPSCQRSFDIAPAELDQPGIRLFCDRCRHVFSVDELLAGSRVIAGIDNPGAVTVLRGLVEQAGLSLLAVPDGEQLLRLCRERPPLFVVCDVALSKVYAFAAVAELKKLTPPPFVCLLASVFDRAAYKRTPASLHGADDYLELHHVPDRLPVMLAKAFSRAMPALDTERMKTQRDHLRDASGEADVQRLDSARELARRLVLDVSLYQQARFKQALGDGSLRVALKDELAEAVGFLAQRMDVSERHLAASLIEQALSFLIAQQAEVSR